jgi:hypothetical protein
MTQIFLLFLFLSGVTLSASGQPWFQGGKPAAGWITVKGVDGLVHMKPLFKIARSVVVDVAHTVVVEQKSNFAVNRHLIGCGNDFFATLATLPIGASADERNRLFREMNTDIFYSPQAERIPIEISPGEAYFGKTKQFRDSLARLCETTKASVVDFDVAVAIGGDEVMLLRISDLRILPNGHREIWAMFRPVSMVPLELEDTEGARIPFVVQGEVQRRPVYAGKVASSTLNRIDCKSKRMSLVYSVRSDGSNALRASEAKIADEFTPVVPGSVGESMFRLACAL